MTGVRPARKRPTVTMQCRRASLLSDRSVPGAIRSPVPQASAGGSGRRITKVAQNGRFSVSSKRFGQTHWQRALEGWFEFVVESQLERQRSHAPPHPHTHAPFSVVVFTVVSFSFLLIMTSGCLSRYPTTAQARRFASTLYFFFVTLISLSRRCPCSSKPV